jgi:hypothetical protein
MCAPRVCLFSFIVEEGEACGFLSCVYLFADSYTLVVDERRGTFRSFLIGSLLGGAAGLAASGRMKVQRRQKRTTPEGLAAFEQAPCYGELVDREAADAGAPHR